MPQVKEINKFEKVDYNNFFTRCAAFCRVLKIWRCKKILAWKKCHEITRLAQIYRKIH